MAGLTRADLQAIASRTGRAVVAAWSDRNAGAMGTVVGVVMHHTGSAWTAAIAPTLQIVREGRSDLQNALCTFYIDKAGTIYLVTEKVAWHAGQGAYRGITDGNGHFLGIEAESDGVRWTTDTVDAYVALVAEIVRFLGADVNTWAIRHATWATPPGRKTDFAGLSETDFKARVTARLNGTPEDDMPPYNSWPAADKAQLCQDVATAIANRAVAGTPGAPDEVALWLALNQVHSKVVRETYDLSGRPADRKDDLLGHVLSTEARVKALADAPQVSAGTSSGTAAIDYAALAKAINDDADRRARDNNPATGPTS